MSTIDPTLSTGFVPDSSNATDLSSRLETGAASVDQFETAPAASLFSNGATLLSQSNLTEQQQLGGLEYVTLQAPDGSQHRVLSVQNAGRYSQHHGEDQDYRWGVNDNLHDIGCTITALGNALGVTGVASPSPQQTNHRTNAFYRAFHSAQFEDLSGQNLNVYARNRVPGSPIMPTYPDWPKIEVMDPVQVFNTDGTYVPQAKEIFLDAAQAVRDGKAVLVGFRGNGQWRHSLVIDAVGDELWVTDPYAQTENGTAKRMPLRDAIVLYEGTEIDYAYAVSRRPPTPLYLRLLESLL